MDPVPLDAKLVEKFRDKVMAIVGFEVDQVKKKQPGCAHCSTFFFL